MRVTAVALLWIAGVCVPAFSQPTPLLTDRTRELAAEQVVAGRYPSLVIGVVEGDGREIVALGSVADDRKREPSGDTVYEIGSVTKTFTALLLADAVARGEAALDDPVQRLLPDYTIPRSGDRTITLRDLATQSSGLPRLPSNMAPVNPANPYADYTSDRLERFLSGHQLSRAPGARYEYSNLGFGLLGQALSNRAGMSYAALLHERIASPLGLNDTAIALSPRLAERFAPGHDAGGKSAAAWDLGTMEGAGAVRSTVNDMLTYVQAHMQPKAGPLSKALSDVTEPQRPTENQGQIALAWQIHSRQGRTVVWHNGMTGGYAAFAGFTADGKRGVVVLTNISRDVGELAFAALLPDAVTPSTRTERSLPLEVLAEYVGRYRLAQGFDLVVTATDRGLRAQATGQSAIPICNRGPDEFFYKAVDAQLTFERDASRKIVAVVLHQGGRDVRAPRVE